MTTTAKVQNLVADLIAGVEVRSAWERLGKCGRRGVDAVLDAKEGKSGPAPKGRHVRDLDEDLTAGLQAIAQVNPTPLIRALDRRPGHTFDLIWALGSSRAPA